MSEKSRNWAITLFLHTTETCWEEIVSQYISTNQLKFMGMGSEVCPDTGTLHYQCYACFPNAIRLKTVIYLFPGCHAEIMRGTLPQNEAYCSKESELIKYGTEPVQGARNDLLEVKRKFDDGEVYKDIVIENENFHTVAKYSRFFKEYGTIVREKRLRTDREMPKVYIRVGQAGTGKTKWLDEQFGIDEWRDIPNSGQWFDTCDERDTCVFDDVERNQIPPFALWKRLCDRYPVQVPVKGGFVLWKPKNIVFTSNCHPRTWWDKLDALNWEAFCRRVYKLTLLFDDEEHHYKYNGIQEEAYDSEVQEEEELQEGICESVPHDCQEDM